jgi:hypothetical protein
LPLVPKIHSTMLRTGVLCSAVRCVHAPCSGSGCAACSGCYAPR